MKSMRVNNSAHQGPSVLTTKFRQARKIFSLTLLAVAVAFMGGNAHAGTYYWDANGTTAGFGTPNGTDAWGTSAFWSTDDSGLLSPTVTSPTTSDALNFGAGVIGLATGPVTISGTQNAGTLTFASGSGTITLSGGTAINLAAASTLTLNNAADTISTPLSGAATSLTKDGTGTLTLSGINTYTGTTIIQAGTLQIGDGTSGSLYGTTGTPLTFNGTGTFKVQEADTVNQGMGTLSFNSGEGTVISTFNTTASTLTFSGMNARSAGATGNITISGGASSANKIVLTSNANAPLSSSGSNDRGIFYNLYTLSTVASFARYDTVTGYFRATSYSTPDLNATTTASPYGSAVDLSLGNVTTSPGASVSLNTLRAVPTATGQRFDVGINTLSINGVLAVIPSQAVQFRVGSTTIGNGFLQPASGSEVVLAGVRADANSLTTSSLAIANVIKDNGTPTKVTFVGNVTIVVQAANTYTGVTTINSGFARVLIWADAGTSSGLGKGSGGTTPVASDIVINGGTLNYGNKAGDYRSNRLFTIGTGGATLDNSGNSAIGNWTIGQNTDGTSSGSIAFSSSTAPATLTLDNNAPAVAYRGIGTLGAALGDPGTGANILSVIKTGFGTWQLAGANTYHGNTTILAGGTNVLTSTGSLTFYPTANGVCNKITGGGTATLNGTFNIDTSNAAIANGNSWTLVDVTTKNSSLTAVTGFTGSSGVWTKVDGNNTWTYTESTGALSLAAKYAVTYNNNGGTGSQTDSNAYNPGATVTVLGAGSMAKTDCTFGGWNTQADRSGTSYSQDDTFSISGNVTLYAKWISASSPVITTSGTLSAVSTTYGTASATTSFTVSGADMIAGITVTPPAGFEVSQVTGGASGYAGSGNAIIVGSAGPIAETTVYVRLAALATVGSYSGNITCTSSSATQKDVATDSSTVDPATLTLTANAQSKPYGTSQTTPVTGSTAFTPAGLQNSETVGTVTLTYAAGGLEATDPAGAFSAITPSDAAGGSFTASNYTIGYADGTLTVVKATPTATLAVNNSPMTYDNSPHAATVGITASSVEGAVQNILTGGAADQTAAGTYAVTADFVPTDTANYNTLFAHAAGNFIINNPPTSSGGSVSMRVNTTNTFAALNFPFSDTDGGTLGAIKVVTSLPTHGTLMLNGTPISSVPSAEILVANIGTLTYTPALNYVGSDSFQYQVRDATAYSADATLLINVTSDITVQNGSFETPTPHNPNNGTNPDWTAGGWAFLPAPWTSSYGANYSRISYAPMVGTAQPGPWICNLNGPIWIKQDLGTTVTEGDILSVTCQVMSDTKPGILEVSFLVGSGPTVYSQIFTNPVNNNVWVPYTLTKEIEKGVSGNLILKISNVGVTDVSDRLWLDLVSNVSSRRAPPKGTVIILW